MLSQRNEEQFFSNKETKISESDKKISVKSHKNKALSFESEENNISPEEAPFKPCFSNTTRRNKNSNIFYQYQQTLNEENSPDIHYPANIHLKHFENELQGADFEGSRKSKDERLAIVNKTLLEENIQLKDYLTKVEDEMKNVKQAYFECFYNYKAKIQELKFKLQEDDIEKTYFSTLITSLFKICNQIPELGPLFKEKAEKSKLWHKIKLRKLQVHSTGTDVFEKAEILEKDEAGFDSEGCEDHSKLEEEIDIYYKRDENFTFSKDRNSEIFSFANGRESEFCSPFPERRKQESLLFEIQETKEVPKLQSKTNAKAEGKTEGKAE